MLLKEKVGTITAAAPVLYHIITTVDRREPSAAPSVGLQEAFETADPSELQNPTAGLKGVLFIVLENQQNYNIYQRQEL